jgi:hypothetical protein
MTTFALANAVHLWLLRVRSSRRADAPIVTGSHAVSCSHRCIRAPVIPVGPKPPRRGTHSHPLATPPRRSVANALSHPVTRPHTRSRCVAQPSDDPSVRTRAQGHYGAPNRTPPASGPPQADLSQCPTCLRRPPPVHVLLPAQLRERPLSRASTTACARHGITLHRHASTGTTLRHPYRAGAAPCTHPTGAPSTAARVVLFAHVREWRKFSNLHIHVETTINERRVRV